jgi:homoserine kinase type II
MKSWWCNTVLRVDADGEQLVLRRYGVTPPEEVRWELWILDHLRTHGFPVVAPLQQEPAGNAVVKFHGKPAILYPFVEGCRGCELDSSLALALTAETVARLHTLTEGVTVPHPRVRSGTEARRMIQGLLDLTAERGVAAHERALRDMLERTQRALGEFEMRIAPYAQGLRRGVVHHDAHCANVLFRDDHIVALIDFDDAYDGYLVADPAAMIAQWGASSSRSDELDLDRAVEVVRAYEKHRPLTDAERDLLPDFLLLFLLSDGAEHVRGWLERGTDGNTAVTECLIYQGYLRLARDASWFAALRSELWDSPAQERTRSR